MPDQEILPPDDHSHIDRVESDGPGTNQISLQAYQAAYNTSRGQPA